MFTTRITLSGSLPPRRGCRDEVQIVMGKFGGLFMLQELQAKSLIGSLRAVATEETAGAALEVIQRPGLFLIEFEGDRIQLRIQRNVALMLVGLLHVQASVADLLLDGRRHDVVSFASPQKTIEVSRDGDSRDMFCATWLVGTRGIRCELKGDSASIWLEDPVPLELAAGLTRELAEIAAFLPRKS